MLVTPDNSSMETIYLDHNATTPTRPEVIEAMAAVWGQGLANPASQHQPGQRARRLLEDAREEIAAILGANLTCLQSDRLIFTSGGTEANNLAVLGIARARSGGKPGRVVVSAIEHASVLEPAQHLLDDGWRVDTLPVTTQGVVRVDRLAEFLSPDTALVSVMLANHETGVLQPVAEVVRLCRGAGVPVHTDAVQAVGKIPVGFRDLGVDAMTVAAHKFQGPLGIGALVLRHDTPIAPCLFGGHQQSGLRPGTESVALAMGMLTALRLWKEEREEHARRLTALRERFERGLSEGYPGLVINGQQAPRLPQTASVAFPGLDGQILLLALDMAGVACSVGSACSSGSTELSPTLLAMGLPKPVIASTLRFSLGSTTTAEEIDEAIRRILHVANSLRQ
ncbi:MAG: cysteine desulfurase [Thermoguttaceae bacterium]|jgi:cysteine desulfurase|nr:cysteine desulfurase [Thermoguttaceae bacterium]